MATMTKEEAIEKLKACDLLKLSMAELSGACQMLGVSGRGDRAELTERIHRTIWEHSSHWKY